MHRHRGGDPEVVGADELSSGGEFPVDLAILLGDLPGPWENGVGMAQSLPIPFRSGRLAAGEFSCHRKGDIKGFL